MRVETKVCYLLLSKMVWTNLLLYPVNVIRLPVPQQNRLSDMQTELTVLVGPNSPITDYIVDILGSLNIAPHHLTNGKFILFFQLEFSIDFYSIQTDYGWLLFLY